MFGVGIDTNIIKMILSFYGTPYFLCQKERQMSAGFIRVFLFQTLYNIFTANFPKVALFADDTAIIKKCPPCSLQPTKFP